MRPAVAWLGMWGPRLPVGPSASSMPSVPATRPVSSRSVWTPVPGPAATTPAALLSTTMPSATVQLATREIPSLAAPSYQRSSPDPPSHRTPAIPHHVEPMQNAPPGTVLVLVAASKITLETHMWAVGLSVSSTLSARTTWLACRRSVATPALVPVAAMLSVLCATTTLSAPVCPASPVTPPLPAPPSSCPRCRSLTGTPATRTRADPTASTGR